MNMILVDFAVCPCGQQTPVRLSKYDPPNNDPRWSGREIETLVIACTKCKRLYRFGIGDLIPQPTTKGLAPDNPDSPTCVFRVPIECDELNCDTRVEVSVALSATTTVAELEEEKMIWNSSGSGLMCSGHEFQWPPYR